jgi:hypothetical protein
LPLDLIIPQRQELEAPRTRALCLPWRPQRLNNLRGFCDIGFPNGLVLCDISVHESNGRRWVSPAGIPVLDPEIRAQRRTGALQGGRAGGAR